MSSRVNGRTVLGCLVCISLFALSAASVGCREAEPGPGTYVAIFFWTDHLNTLDVRSSNIDHPAIKDYGDVLVKQLEPLIREQITRANVHPAKGLLTFSLLGSKPYLLRIQDCKIEVPPFSELLRYVEVEDTDHMEQFISKYHNVDERDLPSQRTALYYAAAGVRPKAIDRLLMQGANPNIPDFEGDSPLMAVITAGSEAIATKLLKSGADPNQADKKGTTPLLRAVEIQHIQMLPILVRGGANPNYVSPGGYSAIGLARQKKDTAAVALLQQLGATK